MIRVMRVRLIKHPFKKGKFVPKDENDVFMHFPVRSQLVLAVDFLGDGKRSAAPNALLMDQKVVKSGTYFRFVMQNLKSNRFVKK
jgi:hypothetical protein